MTAEQLKPIFEKKYNRKEWYNVLRDNFNVTILRENPVDITQRITGNDNNATAKELGNVDTKDGHLIGIYEVEVPENVQMHRNRKGLRSLLNNVYSEVDAALLVLYKAVNGDLVM